MKKAFATLSLFFFLATIPALSPCDAKNIELTLATHMPTVHFFIKEVMIPWTQEVEKRTDGNVKIILLPSQSLGKVNEMYDIVRYGTADMALVPPSQAQGRFPMQEIFLVPYLIPGGMSDPAGIKIRDMLFKKYLCPLEFNRVKVLWTSRFQPAALLLHEKPVASITDVQGYKIGMVGGKMYAEFLKSTGASPEIIVMPEMYTALERGIVDGVLMAKEPLLSLKFNEVVKYVMSVNLGGPVFFTAMNPKTWNKLSPDIQKVINDLQPWVVELQSQAYIKRALMIEKAAKSKGVVFMELSAKDRAELSTKTKYIENIWLSNMKRMNFPGKEVLADINKILSSD